MVIFNDKLSFNPKKNLQHLCCSKGGIDFFGNLKTPQGFVINKKASTPMGVGIIVVLTIILVFFTLYSFNIKNKDIQEKINYPNSLDKVYVYEELINFYANEVLDNSIAKGKTNLNENAKAELVKYKDKDGKYIVEGLKQLEEQTDKISVEGNKVSWKFNMNLSYSEENLKISYNYEEEIEKSLS